jgi:uncharacterized protein YqgV (UPF0045/DUF77 family)
MVGEIAVIPQLAGSGRDIISEVVREIAARPLHYRVGPTGTAVEGELEAILEAVGAINGRLRTFGVTRALIELRLQLEPHTESLEHQLEGIPVEDSLVPSGMDPAPVFGLSEGEIRERLLDELLRSMRVEGGRPTVHAIVHSVARLLAEDHLRMAEQLELAGIALATGSTHPAVRQQEAAV